MAVMHDWAPALQSILGSGFRATPATRPSLLAEDVFDGTAPKLRADSLLRPNLFRTAVKDSGLIGTNGIDRTVEFEYSGNFSDGASVVCVIRPVKHRILKGFTVTSRSGTALRVLASRQRDALLAKFLGAQISRAQESAGYSSLKGCLEEFLLELLNADVRIHSSMVRDSIEGRARLTVMGLFEHARQTTDVEDLATLVAILTTRSPTLIEIPPAEAGYVKYTQVDVFGSATETRQGAPGRVGPYLARSLTAIPNVIMVPDYKRSTSADYQLKFELPNGNLFQGIGLAVDSGFSMEGVRGLGTAELEVRSSASTSATSDRRFLSLRVRQEPTGTPLRAAATSWLVTGVSLVMLLTSRNSPAVSESTSALEVLSWATAIASVAFVSAWAVLLPNRGRMALEISLMLSTLTSSVLLVALVIALAGDPDGPGIKLILIASTVNSSATSLLLASRLSTLRRLLVTDAEMDPEGPVI